MSGRERGSICETRLNDEPALRAFVARNADIVIYYQHFQIDVDEFEGLADGEATADGHIKVDDLAQWQTEFAKAVIDAGRKPELLAIWNELPFTEEEGLATGDRLKDASAQEKSELRKKWRAFFKAKYAKILAKP